MVEEGKEYEFLNVFLLRSSKLGEGGKMMKMERLKLWQSGPSVHSTILSTFL